MAWWIHGRHRHNRNTSVLEHDMSKKSGELERGVGDGMHVSDDVHEGL